MYYAVWATDHPGMLAQRQQLRDAHRARLRDPGGHRVKVMVGGPTLAEVDARMDGSMLVIEADTIDAVRQFLAGDPYMLAGVYADVQVRAFQWGLGQPAATSA